MKKILLIGTGGTIASEVTGDGLAPELTPRQLLAHIPAIAQLCDAACIQLLNLDSTNMAPPHWRRIARCVRDHYDDYDGFVITHGTDTMAYTAAALSYLIQGSPKPVVLTGAQKPIGFDSTDSKVNLADAFRVAVSGMPGVMIVFNGKVILGTRAQKTHSKSFQAFSSINYPYLGVLRDGVLLTYIRPESLPRPLFSDELDTRVGLLKLTPGADRELLDFLLERSDALIIESFGVGGLGLLGQILGLSLAAVPQLVGGGGPAGGVLVALGAQMLGALRGLRIRGFGAGPATMALSFVGFSSMGQGRSMFSLKGWPS
jgi:L-asparaginase